MGFVNEGLWDRTLRVIAGVVLLYLGFGPTIAGIAGSVVGIVGLLLLVTGLIGYCPLYAILRIRTTRAP